jgi:hypothetical protein
LLSGWVRAGRFVHGRSVIFGQQDAGRGAVGFGDDPYLIAQAGPVAAQDATAFPQRHVVLFRVVTVHVAPIAAAVTPDKISGTLGGATEGIQGCRRGYNLTEIEHCHFPSYGENNRQYPGVFHSKESPALDGEESG